MFLTSSRYSRVYIFKNIETTIRYSFTNVYKYKNLLDNMKMSRNVFKLEKRGREEEDYLSDPKHFHFLMKVYGLESEKKSSPSIICHELFDCSNIKNVTKSNEYQTILRYADRWEKQNIIRKIKHRKTYYTIDWNGIITKYIQLMNDLPTYTLVDTTGFNFKNNKYIFAFLKLYYRGILTFPTFSKYITPISFTSSLVLLLNRVIQQIKGNIIAICNYEEKYKKQNPELSNFFQFIYLLCNFNSQYAPHSAIDGFSDYLINYIEFKAKGKKQVIKELIESAKNNPEVQKGEEEDSIEIGLDWYKDLWELEDNLEKINKFHFPD